MRKSCVLCGHIGDVSTMKYMSPAKKLNLVMTASLSLIGVVNRADVDIVVEEISKHNRRLCHSHVAQAARYLSAVMAVTGKRFSYYEDRSAGGSTAYVSTADIPPHLVELINAMSKNNVVITARDVWSFMNSALRRYHGTPLWPTDNGKDGLEETVHSFDTAGSPTSLEPFKVETGAADGTRIIEEEVDVTYSTNTEFSEFTLSISDSECSSASTSHDLGATDAADLRKYYLVNGSMLMKLFRFCPQCGRRLHKAQLKAVGTAAVVDFVCRCCLIRRPSVKTWESQEVVVALSRDKMRTNACK